MHKEKFKISDYLIRLLIPYFLIPLILGLIVEVILIKIIVDKKQSNINYVETTTEQYYNYETEYEIIVCVTKYGTKYHIDDCPYAKNTYEILDLSEAQDRGYKPCSYCCK